VNSWLRAGFVAAVAIGLALVQTQSTGRSATGYDWPQFDEGDWSGMHSGANTQEATIGPANVSHLSQLFHVTLPSTADGAPAYLSAVSTASGTKDLLFLTTKDGHIIALDAHTGATVWSHQYGPGSCLINGTGGPCYTTSSPAVDPSRSYVYSYGLDGHVHKYSVGTGVEVTTGGWPEVATLKAFDEKESPALSIVHTSTADYLYVANGGYPGDNGDYQGHVTTINLATGVQNVFNTMCSNQTVHFVEQPSTPDCSQVQSAVWSRPGVIYDPLTNGGKGSIFFGTGNGTFDPSSYDWGDSVLELNPDGTGSFGNPLDSYTPTNFQALQNNDLDLGSTGPAILPAASIPSASSYKNIAVQGGKDGEIRLLNLDNLSGAGSPGPGNIGGEISIMPVPGGGEVLTQPAVWVNPSDGSIWVFVASANNISGLKLILTAGIPSLQEQWTELDSGATSPLIANGVLYDARSSLIEALNPLTGAQLWSDSTIGGIHWESPIVANGTLYISDESGDLTAFSLGATAARVMWFYVHRRNHTTTLRWRTVADRTIAGFYITAQHRRLNTALIPRHLSRDYSYKSRHAPAGPYNLNAVLVGGTPERVATANSP
jgi:outer membrane protein assembly factor BamB